MLSPHPTQAHFLRVRYTSCNCELLSLKELDEANLRSCNFATCVVSEGQVHVIELEYTTTPPAASFGVRYAGVDYDDSGQHQ